MVSCRLFLSGLVILTRAQKLVWGEEAEERGVAFSPPSSFLKENNQHSWRGPKSTARLPLWRAGLLTEAVSVGGGEPGAGRRGVVSGEGGKLAPGGGFTRRCGAPGYPVTHTRGRCGRGFGIPVSSRSIRGHWPPREGVRFDRRAAERGVYRASGHRGWTTACPADALGRGRSTSVSGEYAHPAVHPLQARVLNFCMSPGDTLRCLARAPTVT